MALCLCGEKKEIPVYAVPPIDYPILLCYTYRTMTQIIMKISYDPQANAAYIRFKKGSFQVTTHNLTEDIAVNYAPDGSVIGIEILDASKYVLDHRRPKIELEHLQSA